MLRVALHRARPDTEWSGQISELEFSSDADGRVAQALVDKSRSRGTGVRSGINASLAVPRSHMEYEIDPEARDGISDSDTLTNKGNFDTASSSKEEVESP
jgi:hypothetical protein